MLEPELPDVRGKYIATGVLGQDGGIYFAPCNAGKVLRICAEGKVELLETGLPDVGGKYTQYYTAAGVLGQDGGIWLLLVCSAA